MKHAALVLLLILTWIVPASGQSRLGWIDPSCLPTRAMHRDAEYTFDIPANPAAWQRQTPGMHVSWASTDRAFLRAEGPDVDPASTWEDTAWRGERLNALVVVWSADTLEQVRIEMSDLIGESGRKIGRENINLYLVRYVVSNHAYDARDVTCELSPPGEAYLMPDRLEPLDRFDLPGRTTRSIWVTVNVPASAAAGSYQRTVTVRAAGRAAVVLNLALRVQNQVLPPPHEWKHRLDLWQNPWAVAWHHQVEPWSEAHRTLFREHLARYAAAGGTYVTTYAVHSP